MRIRTLIGLVGLSLVLHAQSAGAVGVNLADGGSQFTWNTSSATGGNANLTGAAVADMMYAERWFVRVGGTTFQLVNGALAASSADSATISYTSLNSSLTTANVELQMTYTLREIVGYPELTITAQVTNNTGADLTLSLFNYFDYDLNGTFANDHGELTNIGGDLYMAVTDQLVADNAVRIAKAPDHWEMDGFPTLFNKLNTASTTTLSDSGAPFPDPTGFADFTGAYQWDFLAVPDGATVGAGGLSLAEPGVSLLFALSGAALLLGRRRSLA